MAGRVAFLVGFALLAFLHHTGAQSTVHIVGDNAGWAPQGAAFYTNWAAGKTFVANDTLRFNFVGAHDVVRVPKASFDRCVDDNEIGDSVETSPATVFLNTPGEYFFICSVGDHCSRGQKLSITVAATRGATPPSSNSPSPTGSPPSSTGGPQLIPPPPPSSSHAVVAAVSATLFGVVLSLLF